MKDAQFVRREQVEQLAAITRPRRLGLHVDNCLGQCWLDRPTRTHIRIQCILVRRVLLELLAEARTLQTQVRLFGRPAWWWHAYIRWWCCGVQMLEFGDYPRHIIGRWCDFNKHWRAQVWIRSQGRLCGRFRQTTFATSHGKRKRFGISIILCTQKVLRKTDTLRFYFLTLWINWCAADSSSHGRTDIVRDADAPGKCFKTYVVNSLFADIANRRAVVVARSSLVRGPRCFIWATVAIWYVHWK